jgi:hypothetical protein
VRCRGERFRFKPERARPACITGAFSSHAGLFEVPAPVRASFHCDQSRRYGRAADARSVMLIMVNVWDP